jgi:branched-chain amino acid transport system permease protein
MVVSIPTLRLRGFFPAVTTLAFAMATTNYLLNPEYFSWVPVNRVARPNLFGTFNLNSQPSYYYFCLAAWSWWCWPSAASATPAPAGSCWRCGRTSGRPSPSGSTWPGPSSPPSPCRAIAGVGGCLYVHLLQAFTPTVFGPDQSILVFTTAVVGGIGSLLGAALGAIYLEGGQWFLPGAMAGSRLGGRRAPGLMIVPGG